MDEPSYTLRAARPADEPFLFRLYESTRAAELAGLGPEQRAGFLAMQFRAQQRGHRTAFPSAERSIIEVGGEPAGAALVDRSQTQIRLVDIALLPAARGRGIGGTLIRALVLEAGAAHRSFRLQVASDNRARGLYHRLGLKTIADDGVYTSMEWTP